MTKPILAIDCDNVISAFLIHWEMVGRRALSIPMLQVSDDYPLHLRYGMDLEATDKIWKLFHQEKRWRDMPMLDGAIEAVQELHEMGYSNHIVTAIDESILEDRMHNLHSNGLPADIKIHATNGSKLEKLLEIQAICLVDDCADHLDEALLGGIPFRIFLGEERFKPISATHNVTSLKDFVSLIKNENLIPMESNHVPKNMHM